MASLHVFLFLCVAVHAILLLSTTVDCKNNDEEKLLQGINNYRMAMKLPILKDNDNAECLADKVADKLEDQPCVNRNGPTAVPGTGPQFANYPDALRKCKIDNTTTKDGAVLPACVPKMDSSQVLSNFTQSQYAKYFNESKYTGIGIGSEGDWMVVVLSANAPTGALANTNTAFSIVSKVGLVDQCFLSLLVLFLVLLM